MGNEITKAHEGEVIEYVPDQEMMRLRLENEMMMAECRTRPRSLAAMKSEIEEVLNEFPALAETAIYVKPVGKDESGRQKFAEGLSIRSAELLAEVYGYNRVECRTVNLDDDTASIEATFVDYQKGRVWKDTGVVSKWYKGRGGSMTRTPDDRFYGVVCKAEASKRIREVITRSVSAPLKAWFEGKCREVMSTMLDEKGVAKILDSFQKINVTQEMIERFLGRSKSMGWTQEDKQQLMGAWNAIQQRESTPEELFAITHEAGPSKSEQIRKQVQASRSAKDEAAAELMGKMQESKPGDEYIP